MPAETLNDLSPHALLLADVGGAEADGAEGSGSFVHGEEQRRLRLLCR